jgi:hypothetical protein
MNTVSLRRPLSSYAKVQALVGWLIRNRRFQLDRPHVRAGTHLDIGCGLNSHPNLINLDYLWHPGVDVCWDTTRGLPFADGTLRGVFSEHCLEHFPLPAARTQFYQDRESPFGHRTIFDFQLLQLLLQEAGFTRVVRREFRSGTDVRLLIDTPDRRVESLYLEASP